MQICIVSGGYKHSESRGGAIDLAEVEGGLPGGGAI